MLKALSLRSRCKYFGACQPPEKGAEMAPDAPVSLDRIPGDLPIAKPRQGN